MMGGSHKGYYLAALEDTSTRELIKKISKARILYINIFLLIFIFTSYFLGIFLLTQFHYLFSFLAIPILSFSMILAWYLSHDCAHYLVVPTRNWNKFIGEILSWINGFSYFRFSNYSRDHLRHHFEHVDFLGTDVQKTLAHLSSLTRKTILFLEYGYIPVLHFLIKTKGIYDILIGADKRYRHRVLLILLARIFFITWISISNIHALLFYLLCISIRIHCVRFVDAFQHSYAEIDPNVRSMPKDKIFEQKNTFSFPIASKYKFLNLLILNFGFHNAHHAIPSCPWYNLQKLHVVLSSYAVERGLINNNFFLIPTASFTELLLAYHKHRKRRIIFSGQGHPYDSENKFSFDHFTGAFTDKLLG